MIHPGPLSEKLERAFRCIERERMQGLPFLNPVLGVKAVGFRLWQGRCLGVLITPWFMNLILLPGEGDDWRDLPIGDKQLHRLPSGPYEFILGEEADVGRYRMCSLFSPVLEFADRATAEATAEAAMQALMDESNRDGISTCEGEVERRWRGGTESDVAKRPDANPDPVAQNSPSIGERLERPLSRRDLLRGRLPREGKR